MQLEACLGQARDGRLYPGLIVHGGNEESRLDAAVQIARIVLCERPAGERPCSEDDPCRHCRRIVRPGSESDLFHADFYVLERDLRTSTSAEATRAMLRTVHSSPFEARGQVFVVRNAETLTGGAANALLKSLEEPPTSAPRHFLLLCPSAVELLPTLRSRCLPVYLGSGVEDPREDPEVVALADELVGCLASWREGGGAVWPLVVAGVLQNVGGFEDPRASRPWWTAAAALLDVARRTEARGARRRLLSFAEALLEAPEWRLRGIPAQRILEGLASRHLGAR